MTMIETDPLDEVAALVSAARSTLDELTRDVGSTTPAEAVGHGQVITAEDFETWRDSLIARINSSITEASDMS